MNSYVRSVTVLTCVVFAASVPFTAVAQDDAPELGWSFTGELSAVLTQGNTETSTFGLGGKAVRTAEGAEFAIKAGGLMVDTTASSRRAVGTPGSFDVIETSVTETTAESYYLRGRYDRQVSARLFWYAGAGWERNEFAGFDNRFTVLGGLGHRWLKSDTARFSTYYGITYTQQDDIVEAPRVADGFAGVQIGYDDWRRLTPSTVFESNLVIDANVDESEDLRADFLGAIAVSMNDWLALKVSLHLLWDNLPALEALALENPAGMPTGDVALVELDDLDTVLTVGVVVTR